MYERFRAENFRAFRLLDVGPLSRLNLITGLNNVGKTALLEAVLIHAGAPNLFLARFANMQRGLPPYSRPIYRPSERRRDPMTEMVGLFHNYEREQTIMLVGAGSPSAYGATYSLRLRRVIPGDETPVQRGFFEEQEASGERLLPMSLEMLDDRNTVISSYGPKGWAEVERPREALPVVYLPARDRLDPVQDAERFGELEIAKSVPILVEALQIIEPRLTRLSVAVVGGYPVIHGEVQGLDRLMPIGAMGDGMGRLVSIVLAISACPGGVVLLDEVENGLHHSVMSRVMAAVAKAAKLFDVQVLATTHSGECLAAACEAFHRSPELDPAGLSVHRLERDADDDVTRSYSYDIATLQAAIDAELEVR